MSPDSLGVAGILVAVFGGVFVVLAIWFMLSYNGLVRLRNQVKNAWSQIDVQLKRRHDLIPNLVETVKGYATHERETLQKVVEARGAAVSAHGPRDQAAAEQELSGALGRLLLVVEHYPDLKANANFMSLQEELSSTENRIGFARQSYNDSVMGYNTRRQTIPDLFVAGMFGFAEEAFFEIETPQERQVPKVNF